MSKRKEMNDRVAKIIIYYINFDTSNTILAKKQHESSYKAAQLAF